MMMMLDGGGCGGGGEVSSFLSLSLSFGGKVEEVITDNEVFG